MTAAERSAIVEEVRTAARQAFAEILDEQADGARSAARLAHTLSCKAERDDERGEQSSAYFRGQHDALDAIADQFDRVACKT